MPGKVTLAVTAGAKQGETFVFDQHDTLLFGRMDDCQICLPDDQQISRHHFILEVNPLDARLRDLGSKNGTSINGQKYGGREQHETPEEGARRQFPQVDLHDGDEIKVGRTVLRLTVEALKRPAERVQCQRCGRDVSAEISSVEGGDYVCTSCCQQVQADPEVLQSLLKQFAQANVSLHIPDYQVEQKLGQGGMGAVYLVRHKQHGRRAALKVLLAKVAVDEHARNRFLREVKVTRSLEHPHVVKFLDCGAAGSLFYFLLEYCEGGSVHDLMRKRGGRLTLDEAGPMLLQALDGLAYVHAQGVVHRDLKPQNILLAGTKGHWVAKVADLGLAKSFEQAGFSGMSVTGGVAGSYPFMPREQLINCKYCKPVSDVWSMGATCYNILTGRYPREHKHGQDQLEVILDGKIVPIRQRDSGIPKTVAEVIDRALADNVNERYQHAGEMRDAWKRALTC